MELEVSRLFGEGAKQIVAKSKKITAQMEILHPFPSGRVLFAMHLLGTTATILLTWN
jgi:hypothetical protein